MKYLGICDEFVGVSFLQDLERGLMELKQPDYWLKSGKTMEKYFPDGFKRRENPMTPADDRAMTEEVTDEEFKAAESLPYRQLCGIVSYPASCTKLEMRYAVSVRGRHRSKWGAKQWNILKKVFEYGYYTRDLGLIYSAGLDEHGDNTLYAYADASHNPPRSQGCHVVMMNGAAVSCESKRHTIMATSTCHDEMIQFSKGANKICGFRNLMQEGGMYQQAPSRIYQDNEANIKVLENRGSLSSKTRHIEMNVLSARNKVEDQLVKPVYKFTGRMAADFGTKGLPDEAFKICRDVINGYGLVKKWHPDRKIPGMVIDPWTNG